MAQTPHVVMVHKAYPPWIGGIERHIRDIAEALVARGWRVTALVCNTARFECRELRGGVQIIRMPQWGRFFSQPIVTGYLRRLRELQPDLVHVHVPFPLGWWTVKSVPLEVPILCTWHSDIVRQRGLMPFLSRFQKRFLRRCARIIVTSQPLMDHSSALKRHRERCTVIPLAIPTMRPEEEIRIQNEVLFYQKEYPGKVVLFVGRLVGYKGLSYLLQAMKSVSATLLIAGEGPLQNDLQRWVYKNGLSGKVHFLGRVSEWQKSALYRIADLFVLPSITRNEAFGYVLLEAMMRGCPAISTDLPTGVKWVNQDGESGLVVPPRDPQALSLAIQQIINHEDERARLSQGARDRIENLFCFDQTIDQLETVYQETLSSGGHPAS